MWVGAVHWTILSTHYCGLDYLWFLNLQFIPFLDFFFMFLDALFYNNGVHTINSNNKFKKHQEEILLRIGCESTIYPKQHVKNNPSRPGLMGCNSLGIPSHGCQRGDRLVTKHKHNRWLLGKLPLGGVLALIGPWLFMVFKKQIQIINLIYQHLSLIHISLSKMSWTFFCVDVKTSCRSGPTLHTMDADWAEV